MPLAGAILDDESDLARIRDGWDALAVEAGRPYCAPDWMLSWWRNVGPRNGGLRIVAVRDGDRLVGVMPLCTNRTSAVGPARYEVLGYRLSPPAGPLIAAGREREVLESMSRALASATPKPALVRFWDYAEEDLIHRIREAWPSGRPWVHAEPQLSEPIVSLGEPDFERWLAERSGHFRRDARRCRRNLDEQGAEFGMAALAEMDEVIGAFINLHMARWRDPAESGLNVPGLQRMLGEAAAGMARSGRLRIFTIRIAGRLIAANLYVVAGTQINAWNSGFDPRWARFSPAMLLDIYALADAMGRGETRMSLGPGDGGYKRRFANTERKVAIVGLAPRGVEYPLVRLQLESPRVRRAVKGRLSSLTEGVKARKSARGVAESGATPVRRPGDKGKR